MKNHRFDEGLSVVLTDDLELTEDPGKEGKRKIKVPLSGAIPMPEQPAADLPPGGNPVLEIVKRNGLELVKEVNVGSLYRPTAIRAVDKAAVAEFQVDLGEHEEAVLLLEQDGMYIWKYPEQTKLRPGTRKRGIQTEFTSKQAVFQIQLALSPYDSNTRSIAGEVSSFMWGKVKAYVLKFLAGKSVELIRDWLEKDVTTGLIHLNDQSPENWPAIDNITSLNLPEGRPPKILLFIHGTFSSTVGAYGVLAGTPWGLQLLTSAFENYDAVIGYNHFTLKEDPLKNAQELFTDLHKLDWPTIPEFDVIAHSRGGLVIRSLVEMILPGSAWKPKVSKIIFVACTNEGTLLAESKNWEDLINLYTNLAVGTSRVIGLIMPQSKVVTLILNDIIQSIGTFIKYCGSAAVTEKAIPGLSAMEPAGDFIKEINLVQPGQPTIADSQYFAITSDFKPRLTGDQEPKELPKRFLQLIAAGFMGQLMKDANDLVVNLDSMTAIDKEAGDFIRERYDFGENAQVYHTNYFTRPEVVNAITRWLNLMAPLTTKTDETATPKKRSKTTGRTTQPIATLHLPLLYHFDFKDVISPKIDIDILSVSSGQTVNFLRKSIKEKKPSYVVVQRPYQGTIINYAFAAEQAQVQLESFSNFNDASIQDAFNLHETDAWDSQDLTTEISNDGPVHPEKGAVILQGNSPIGVIPPHQPLPNVGELIKISESLTNPESLIDDIRARRALPSFASPAEKIKRTVITGSNNIIVSDIAGSNILIGDKYTVPTPQKDFPPEDEKQVCYFSAEMDEEVAVKRATSLMVTISAKDLQLQAGPAATSGSGVFKLKEKILIRIIVKSGFIITDVNDGQAEATVPEGDESIELLFDLKATEQAGDGEIWVMARQGQVNIIKMVLKPKVVWIKNRATKVSEAKSIAMANVPAYSLNQLWISERPGVEGIVYRFEFYSEKLKIRKVIDSLPIKGNREQYVTSLYKNIEARWVSTERDHDNFVEELRSFGTQLFTQLMPVELQKLLWDNRGAFDSIQVISSEPFIPWELVHLKDPASRGLSEEVTFLGDMGLIRWLDGAGENGWPPETIKVRDGQVKYVIPHYPHPDYELPEALEEEQFLIDTYQATPITPESGAVRSAISVPGKFDLLHFACHGGAELESISDARLLMQGRLEKQQYIIDSFTSTVAQTYSNLKSEDNHPMIVLNACQAGLAGYQLTGIGGFAAAFLNGGAGAFVGALWSVGDKPARYFTQTLYEALNDGDTLSTATVKGRQKARQEKDATWLAYVVYGNPYLKIDREA